MINNFIESSILGAYTISGMQESIWPELIMVLFLILLIVVIILVIKLKQTNKALVGALKKAQESDQLKSVFLRNLSHEIRTPLNGISGFSLLLQDEELDHNIRVRYTDLIISSGRQLIGVVDNIVAASLIETKQEKVNESTVNINDIIYDLHSAYNNSVDEKDIDFVVSTDLDGHSACICTDHIKLNQVLDNLLSNAVKFTSKGFIEVGYQNKNKFVEFFVKDSGVGINDQKRDRIFILFSQEDNSNKRKYEGAGLGLSVAKGYVELLGGEIYFDSEKDKGTNFYFTIPNKMYKH